MSAGAIFNLIANDGKADRMILASDLLKARIRNIMCVRAKNGAQDPTPTLLDIEKTHILFVNAHYKPFAALAYEYLKVPGNRSASFGQATQYSIPQFGDFIYDMVLNVVLAQTSATSVTLPVASLSALPFIGANDTSTTATSKISATRDVANGIYTVYTQRFVTKDGTVLTPGTDVVANHVRYAEWVGERFAKKIKFDVNGNPLDEYTSEAMLYNRKFKVAPHKMTGYKRMVGQEVEKQAISDLSVISGVSNFDPNASDLVAPNGTVVAGAPVSSSITARRVSSIVSGPQTPKATQPALEMWLPLLFWFNKDVRLSIPSVAIPYGMRFINVDVEAQSNLLFVAPGNVYLETITEIVTDNGATNSGTASATVVTDYKKIVNRVPYLVSGSVIDGTQQISTMDLYINNIFVNPEIHDIYIKRIGFSLIRVHKLHTQRLTAAQDKIQLTQLKWPVEHFFAGVRPVANIATSNVNQYRDWHRMTANTDSVIDIVASSSVLSITDSYSAVTSVALHSEAPLERITLPVETATLDNVKIVAHGIDVYKQINTPFYRDYIPYTYGGLNIVTPEDEGAIMVNFCLYPGQYQPSGHINISRAREFFFEYVSSYVGSSTQADLIVLASAINFLLISDGSAVLRYST